MRVAGVDPGLGGALALLDNARLVEVHDMPVLLLRKGKTDKRDIDGYALLELVKSLRADVVYIERVGGIPGCSTANAFSFGYAAAAPRFLFQASGVRVAELVPPQNWQRALGLVKAGKDGSRSAAMRLWPEQAKCFSRVKDDGRAEAALIAEFGRRQEINRGFFS